MESLIKEEEIHIKIGDNIFIISENKWGELEVKKQNYESGCSSNIDRRQEIEHTIYLR